MIKSILVILDDSESSESATQLGVTLAQTHGATIAGLGILDTPWLTTPEAIPLGGTSFKVDLEGKILKDAKQRIHTLELKFTTYCKSRNLSSSIIDTTGIPFEEVEYFATEFDALVVGKDATFHLGTHPEASSAVKRIIKSSPRPLFITSPQMPYQKKSDVLIAFDGTVAASKSLHMAIFMGLFKEKTLHIVSVSENEEHARQWTSSALKLCHHHDLKAHLHPIASALKPSLVIRDLINDLTPSLLVMGAYGHSGIRSFFMGSCIQELFQETDVPVFVFH
jgi:nucleotide-binding universal stress UspA family protein